MCCLGPFISVNHAACLSPWVLVPFSNSRGAVSQFVLSRVHGTLDLDAFLLIHLWSCLGLQYCPSFLGLYYFQSFLGYFGVYGLVFQVTETPRGSFFLVQCFHDHSLGLYVSLFLGKQFCWIFSWWLLSSQVVCCLDSAAFSPSWSTLLHLVLSFPQLILHWRVKGLAYLVPLLLEFLTGHSFACSILFWRLTAPGPPSWTLGSILCFRGSSESSGLFPLVYSCQCTACLDSPLTWVPFTPSYCHSALVLVNCPYGAEASVPPGALLIG